MTLDQKIQLGSAIGTWIAGFATLFAVLVSLNLARKAERIRLKASVGVRLLFEGNGTPAEEHVAFSIVNLSNRPVIIDSVGWRIGRKRNMRFAIQPLHGRYTEQYPKRLEHGEKASFLVSFKEIPNWIHEFSSDFIQDISKRNLKTLRALIHTSVGETIQVKPESSLLNKIREVQG